MNSTYYDCTLPAGKTVLVLPGHNRSYSIGDVAYRTARPVFPNGTVETLPRFASLMPVMYVDGVWKNAYLQNGNQRLIKVWTDPCTVIEVTP